MSGYTFIYECIDSKINDLFEIWRWIQKNLDFNT